MTPRPPRLLVGGILAALTLALLSALATGPAGASSHGGSGNNTTLPEYAIPVKPVAGEAHWATEELQFPEGSNVSLVYDSAKSVLPHDIQICPADADPAACAVRGEGLLVGTRKGIDSDTGLHPTPIFRVPAEGLQYVCSLHPDTMVGTLSVGEFTLGGAAHESIVQVGVNFLAYWVGVISFAILFVFYGASFFLFKHGENPSTTDHKDRPDFGEKRTIMGLPEYVFIIFAVLVVAIGVVIFFRIMLSRL